MAVLLALISAVLFGAMTVVLRFALRRSPDAEVGTLVTTSTAFVVVSVFALVRPPEFDTGDVLVFALAGLLAPGGSQLLFTLAVRDAGPARASVIVGAAPLFAVAIALVALDEPLDLPLATGAVLIVVGGIALVGERIRPEHFRLAGFGFALAATVLFATRDNFVRWSAGDAVVHSGGAAGSALLAAVLVMLAYVALVRGPRAIRPTRETVRAYAPAGLLFGLSYLSLFEAYYRGRVGVVSPIVATESLWAVLLSALLIGRSELIGRRLVGGAVLIVVGGALIGAFR